MRRSTRSTSWRCELAALLFTPVLAFAHGDDDIRFVTMHGVDNGGCDAPTVACKSIGYAAGQAGKGGVVRVAGGQYEVATQDDLFHIQDDGTDLTGGWSADFETRDPTVFPTVLIAAPLELRQSLQARGFQVIADTKWVGTGKGADPLLLAENVAVMQGSSSFAACTGGSAGGFACQSVNLHSHLALADFSSAPSRANDVWGFRDLNTEREYALVGLYNGLAVVDVTDPATPVEIGTIPGERTGWRDVKVLQTWDAAARRWNAWAYLTADAAHDRLTVVDLSGLPNRVGLVGRLTDDLSAHNVNLAGVDPSFGIPLTGTAPVLYLAGSNLDGGAFRAFDLTDPGYPQLVGQSFGGYMHDGTAITLRGPDRTVLADFNESEVQLWDVTVPAAPRLLSSFSYPTTEYVHSGSWSEDGRYLFVHDEIDERDGELNTTVYVFDVADVSAPMQVGAWSGPTRATDHNGYARGNRYYVSNYARGLTILDLTDPAAPVAVGNLDSYTVSDGTGFNGAWGVYPYLPSRALLVSDVQGGLYVLEDMTLAVPAGSLGFAVPVLAGREGDTVTLEVARTAGSTGAVSVAWELLHGSAGTGDVAFAAGRLDWADGDITDKPIELDLLPDGEAEGVERFFVKLLDPEGGATLGEHAIASVFVDEPGSAAALAVGDPGRLPHFARRAYIAVARTGSAMGEVRLDYATEAGTAVAGDDFIPVNGRLVWPDGDATGRVVEIPLVEGRGVHTEKAFTVRFSNAVGAAPGAGSARVLLAIEPPPPPLTPPVVEPLRRSGGGAIGPGVLLASVVLIAWFRRRQPTEFRIDPAVRMKR